MASTWKSVVSTCWPTPILTFWPIRYGAQQQVDPFVGREVAAACPILFEVKGCNLNRFQAVNPERTALVRYHVRLSSMLSEIILPSAEQEKANPTDADAAYTSCGDYFLSKTRDKERFQLLFQENVNYGFRRNLCRIRLDASLTVAKLIGLT
jgi:hypothetical protein